MLSGAAERQAVVDLAADLEHFRAGLARRQASRSKRFAGVRGRLQCLDPGRGFQGGLDEAVALGEKEAAAFAFALVAAGRGWP
jgi:hypothetical protein